MFVVASLSLAACGNTPDRRIDTVPDPYGRDSTTTSTPRTPTTRPLTTDGYALDDPADPTDRHIEQAVRPNPNRGGPPTDPQVVDPDTSDTTGPTGTPQDKAPTTVPRSTDTPPPGGDHPTTTAPKGSSGSSSDDANIPAIPMFSPDLAVRLSQVPTHTCEYFNRTVALGEKLYYSGTTDLAEFKSITSEMVADFAELGRNMPAPYLLIYQQLNGLAQGFGRQVQNAMTIREARDLLGYVADRMAPMMKRIMELHPDNCASQNATTSPDGP